MCNNDISSFKKIEGGRAEFAYKCAEDGKKILEKSLIDNKHYKDDKYKSYVKKIPAMIKTNGLASTFAFIQSKGKKPKNGIPAGNESNPANAYDLIYKQITDWTRDGKNKFIPDDCQDLNGYIVSMNPQEYRALTIEILSFFNWLRRFAEGLIETEEDGND